MLEYEIESELNAFESGKMSRRQLVARLGAVAAAAWAIPDLARAQTESGGGDSTFTGTDINHIALRVTDLDRSREFYQRHLGLELASQNRFSVFMRCSENNFVAMFKHDTPGMDHYCYSIEDFRIGPVVERLENAGLKPRRQEDRVYFDDPDGIEVQLASKGHGV